MNLPIKNGDLAVCQNLVPLVNIKIAGKWMFIPLKMVLIGIDPYPFPPVLRCQKKTVHPPPTWRLVRTAPQGQGDGAGSQGIAIQQGLRSVKTPGFSQKKKTEITQ